MQKSLIEPDAFLNDWYGWLTNQASHIGLGVLIVFIFCISHWHAYGEMPVKTDTYLLILFSYFSFEVITQGWRGFDTIEDSVFVVGYGAGAVLSGFTELTPGSPIVTVDVVGLLPFFLIAAIHLFAGSTFRLMQKH